MQRMQ